MTNTLQSELPLSAARLRRPCGDRRHAQAVLDVDDWQLTAVLDCGRLPGRAEGAALTGVLDVASKGSARRELRFVTVCLEEFKRGIEIKRSAADLAVLIFGLREPLVRVRRIYSRLLVKHSHFYQLIADRELKIARGSVQRCGPGGSAIVEWPELVRFIEKRRVA